MNNVNPTNVSTSSFAEECFRQTIEHAPVGIVHVGADGAFLRVNPAFCEVTGYSEDELKKKTFGAITHPDDLEADVAYARQLAAGQIQRYTLEKRYIRKDGSAVWVNLTGSAVRDAGQLVYYIGIIEDISRRKAAEAALRESNERLNVISRATNDVLWEWNLSTGALWWSEGFVKVFGHPAATMSAIDAWKALIHPEDRERVVEGTHRALESDAQYWQDEYRLARSTGDYAVVSDRGIVLRDERGKPLRMIGAMQDITERKNAERRLIEAQAELQRHAVRLEAAVAERTARLQELVNELGTFSYSVSHDLRAPLRSIQGFAELLREDVGAQLPEASRSHLDRVIRAAHRMDSLIKDVLEYSRINRAELVIEDVDPAEIVRDAIDAQQRLQAPAAMIEVVAPLPKVRASRPALTQIMSNLLGNAVKFVAPGTTPHVKVRAEADGQTARIWVEDNGIGIAPQNHEKIWGMLERLNANYEGTGVGLSIVRKAVERMGGRVGVQSALGEGSRFWIELPRA